MIKVKIIDNDYINCDLNDDLCDLPGIIRGGGAGSGSNLYQPFQEDQIYQIPQQKQQKITPYQYLLQLLYELLRANIKSNLNPVQEKNLNKKQSTSTSKDTKSSLKNKNKLKKNLNNKRYKPNYNY